MLALAIACKPHRSQTLVNIEREGEFVVNLPDMSLADKLVETSYKTKLGTSLIGAVLPACPPEW